MMTMFARSTADRILEVGGEKPEVGGEKVEVRHLKSQI
jgi:hypothetical protein